MQMKRPIVWMALPVAVISALGSAFHIGFLFIFFILLIIFISLFFTGKIQKNHLFFLFIFSLISLVIISFSSKKPETIEQLELSEKYEHARIQGRVKKITQTEDGMKLILSGCVDMENNKINGVVVYCPVNNEIETGAIILAEGRLQALSIARNEGNFNERQYYSSLKIYSKMKTERVDIIRPPDNIFFVTAGFISKNIKNCFKNISPEYEGRISSIVLGDQSNLDPDVKELYKDSGIAHLLAISGLHISFAGSVIYRLLRGRGVSFFSSALCAGFCVITYTVMTGSALSAIRASVMFLFAVTADVAGRTYDAPSALSAQMIATLFVYPASITSASFLLSYMSVTSIIISDKLFKNSFKSFVLKLLLSDFKISFAIFIGLLPANLYYYYETPVYSVFLNMLILPLAGLLMGISLAAGLAGIVFPPAGVFLIGTAERIFDIYDFLCNTFSKFPHSSIVTGRPSPEQILIYYALVLLSVIIFLQLRKKSIFFKFVIPLSLVVTALFLITKQTKNDFYLAMIDVGQGDCILVHTESGKNILFDGGSSDIKNAYKYRLESFLKYRGISKIDACFISHSDDDHINIICDLLDDNSIKTDKLILPDIKNELRDEGYMNLETKAGQKNIPVSYAKAGFKTGDESFNVKCISPDEKIYNALRSEDINAYSAVYYYTDDDISALLTGDMTSDTEKYLLENKKIIKTDILKVAHHGSKNSSTEEFIDKAAPMLGIVSCGVNNRYGHPADETLLRFKETKTPVIATKDRGGIIIYKEKDKLSVDCFLNTK